MNIPKWVFIAVTVTATIFGVGWRLGAQVNAYENRVTQVEQSAFSLNYRLCRMEKALGIPPYQTCQP